MLDLDYAEDSTAETDANRCIRECIRKTERAQHEVVAILGLETAQPVPMVRIAGRRISRADAQSGFRFAAN